MNATVRAIIPSPALLEPVSAMLLMEYSIWENQQVVGNALISREEFNSTLPLPPALASPVLSGFPLLTDAAAQTLLNI